MSIIEQQVQRVRRRLNSNVLFGRLTVGVAIAAGLWSLAVIIERAFSLGMPFGASVTVAAVTAIAVTAISTYLRRVSPLQAAVAIDAAAGLKERVSSALVLARHEEPFAQAAVHDAEKVATSIHVPTHMPLRAPARWPMPLASVAVAAILYAFMPNLNLLAGEPEDPSANDGASTLLEREDLEVAIAAQKTRISQRLENKPQLAGLMDELDQIDIPEDPDMSPEDIRRDVVKKVDRVSDKIEAQLRDEKLAALEEMRKDLAKLDTPPGKDPASKLADNLSKGDMQGAKAALEDLKKQIQDAQEAAKDDPAAAAKLTEMQKKLTDLSEQLDKLATTQKMQKELENKLGMNEEDANKLLEQIMKMDPKDIEKALQKAMAQKQNLSDEQKQQIKEMAKKLMQQKAAQQQLKQMAQAMQKAAQACQKGQEGGDGQQSSQSGSGALSDAMDQLSDLEMSEQMMNELEATLADLKNMKEGACQCGQCPGGKPGDQDKIGGQGPQEGLGWGARTGKKAAAHQYENQRVKSQMSQGQIIGQMLIDGPQVRGDANAEARDAIRSAVRDATDAIEREEVPRQYEKVLRNYFMSLAGLADEAPAVSAEGVQPAPADPPKPVEKAKNE